MDTRLFLHKCIRSSIHMFLDRPYKCTGLCMRVDNDPCFWEHAFVHTPAIAHVLRDTDTCCLFKCLGSSIHVNL
jgi:hypothetical protein